MPNIYDVLQQRGFVNDCTDAVAFHDLVEKKSVTVYCGFDPTADSLHAGNMVALMGLLHFQGAGHRPIVVTGGATGMIGDPSGKGAERNLQTPEQVERNVRGQRPIFEKFLRFDGENAALILNNHDWLGPISFIEFLRDVGKNFRLGDMLGRESVRARLQSEAGISFTEFSYVLLQAYDFQYLFEHHGCEVQCGGADQWGNITAGMELIRKALGKQAYGITFPLLTTATGQKFGKSESGAIWLDAAKTPVFDFYQYWVRADDRDVERFLKMFTLLPLEEIESIVREHERAPENRAAQKRLAFEVTKFVHGEAEAEKAREAAAALYEVKLENLTDAQLEKLFADAPSVEAALDGEAGGAPLLDVLVQGGLAPSKKEAKKLLQQGGLYLNDKPVDPEKRVLTRGDLASESLLLLRAGKKRYCLVRLKDEG